MPDLTVDPAAKGETFAAYVIAIGEVSHQPASFLQVLREQSGLAYGHVACCFRRRRFAERDGNLRAALLRTP